MSTLIVEVCEVKEIKTHSNADSLEIALIKGWNVIVQKSLNLQPGTPVVYFPPDCVMSEELANRLGILKYLQPVKSDGEITGYRVRAARLRGEPSYGTIDHAVPEGFKVGDDVREFYGVTKYEPPVKSCQGDVEPDCATFHRYTDIESVRNFPDVFEPGEWVAVTEKIHGSNVRIGLCRNDGGAFEFMAGSHNQRRREFDAKGNRSDYWLPLNDDLKYALESLSGGTHDVIIFGELLGAQDMRYGLQNGKKDFRAFDISINGNYLGFDAKIDVFDHFGIPMVPLLFDGCYTEDRIDELTYGDTTVCDPAKAGKFKGREGIVITAWEESRNPRIGRKILKSVSADYLARSGGTEGH